LSACWLEASSTLPSHLSAFFPQTIPTRCTLFNTFLFVSFFFTAPRRNDNEKQVAVTAGWIFRLSTPP
jgi:hypothetical protein